MKDKLGFKDNTKKNKQQYRKQENSDHVPSSLSIYTVYCIHTLPREVHRIFVVYFYLDSVVILFGTEIEWLQFAVKKKIATTYNRLFDKL